MGTREFIASLASSLAWPLAILAISVIFRTQLRGLLTGQLKRLRAGPLEAEFDRVYSHVQGGLPSSSAAVVDSPVSEELKATAETAPRAAIIEAHKRVDDALRVMLYDIGEKPSETASTMELASQASQSGLITPDSLRAVEGVTMLKNLAVGGPSSDVAEQRVDEFLVLVDSVLYALRGNVRSRRDRSLAAASNGKTSES
jgi:hypothetical protein